MSAISVPTFRPRRARTGAQLAAEGRVGVETSLYRWYWKARMPERRGQIFMVLARGKLNSCLIEFVEDGWRVITSRNALRRAPGPSPPPG
mgnify:CR=1 FL=1